MVPRIPKVTLHDWRERHPDWNQAIDEAWEIGCAMEVMKMHRIADGAQPLVYGHTTATQRAQYRADVKRDRLRINGIQWSLERLNRRYQNRQVLAGDSDAPLIPSTFMIQPVRASHEDHEDHEDRPDHEDE